VRIKAGSARSEIEAIPTPYLGYNFRSRLEARWVVFFNQLGIKFEYEPEFFKIRKTYKCEYRSKNYFYQYLPDFWLPEIGEGCWFEVKGVMPNAKYLDMMTLFRKKVDKAVFMAVGSLPDADSFIKGFKTLIWSVKNKNPYCAFCVCPTCREIGIKHEGRSEWIECSCDKDKEKPCRTYADKQIVAAYETARKFKFD
jgi:hypothetical protein